jgi:hypothetical protein
MARSQLAVLSDWERAFPIMWTSQAVERPFPGSFCQFLLWGVEWKFAPSFHTPKVGFVRYESPPSYYLSSIDFSKGHSKASSSELRCGTYGGVSTWDDRSLGDIQRRGTLGEPSSRRWTVEIAVSRFLEVFTVKRRLAVICLPGFCSTWVSR